MPSKLFIVIKFMIWFWTMCYYFKSIESKIPLKLNQNANGTDFSKYFQIKNWKLIFFCCEKYWKNTWFVIGLYYCSFCCGLLYFVQKMVYCGYFSYKNYLWLFSLHFSLSVKFYFSTINWKILFRIRCQISANLLSQ